MSLHLFSARQFLHQSPGRLLSVENNSSGRRHTSSFRSRPLTRSIQLPKTWKGRRAKSKALKRWKEGLTQHLGRQADTVIAQRKGRLLLEVNERPGQSDTLYSRQGISFAPGDPLGAELWKIANPTLWSKRPRWLRWLVYVITGYLSGLLGIFY